STEFTEPVAWMPDNRGLLALRSSNLAFELGMVNVSDGAYRTLKVLGRARPSGVSLSPDGAYAAFDRPGDDPVQRDIAVVAVADGRESLVLPGAASDYHPLWTPDGSALVFLSNRATEGRSLWSLRMLRGEAAGAPQLLKSGM